MPTVLFLCTGNSARSVLGEVIFNEYFSNHGRAYSAGSNPVGQVNPAAITILQSHGHDVSGLKSQNVDEFTGEGTPTIDIVISVCDNAARDCPVWPGPDKPQRLHWPLPDPAAVEGQSEKLQAFEETYNSLKERLTQYFIDS